MKKLLAAAAIAAAISPMTAATPALACSPAPSCWIDEGPGYLKEICKGYAKDGRTVQQIKAWLDEPEKAQEFAAACIAIGVKLKSK